MMVGLSCRWAGSVGWCDGGVPVCVCVFVWWCGGEMSFRLFNLLGSGRKGLIDIYLCDFRRLCCR